MTTLLHQPSRRAAHRPVRRIARFVAWSAPRIRLPSAWVALALASAGALAQPASSASPAAATAASAPLFADDAAALELVRVRIENEKAQAKYYAKQASQAETPSAGPWLQTLLGGLIAIVAGIVTGWWTGRLSEEKMRREEERLYLRQRAQLRLAAAEAVAVLKAIPASGAVPAYFSETLLYLSPVRPTSPDRGDPYYLKYDLVNTVYRFCAFLGWLEIYRTDPAFLRGPSDEGRSLEAHFERIRSDLAAVLPADASAAPPVRDGFVLEDDQRAIGEQMMTRGRSKGVLGYAAFCERLFRDPQAANPVDPADATSQNWWVWNATRFFVELEPASGTDLKRRRIADLVEHLTELVHLLR